MRLEASGKLEDKGMRLEVSGFDPASSLPPQTSGLGPLASSRRRLEVGTRSLRLRLSGEATQRG
jgi:hypothetical protein